jgi:hypothetical protein
MGITAEEIEREKQTLPFGWGRFGKALDQLSEIVEPSESLVATCVALSPEYRYNARFVPGSALGAGHALHEFTKSMNVVLACTSERLIMISTSGVGAPREHVFIPYEGLEIVSQQKKEFVLRVGDQQMRIRGAAKQQLPRFLEALAVRVSPPQSDQG